MYYARLSTALCLWVWSVDAADAGKVAICCVSRIYQKLTPVYPFCLAGATNSWPKLKNA